MSHKNLTTTFQDRIKAVSGLLLNRLYMGRAAERNIVDQFHQLFSDAGNFNKAWSAITWLGVPIKKCPFDLWVYQEIITDVRPDFIIECGTAYGGSALFLASLCDLLHTGQVVTIDIEDVHGERTHPRIHYLLGSSTSEEIITRVQSLTAHATRVLVILDSDHHADHVLRELRLYSPLVTVDSYIIVEDTNMNGHPVSPNFGPGPMEAVTEFLKTETRFVIDRQREEKLLLTFNPKGYLKRIRA